MTEQDIHMLIQEAQQYGVQLSNEKAKKLLKHLELVIEKNQFINLTRIVDWQDGIDKHVLDSLTPLTILQDLGLTEKSHCLDIGTGAGFPGIPLSICSEAQFTLIDSTEKKIKEVQYFIDRLELDNCSAQAVRAEELAKKQSQKFDFILARAVSQMSTLIEYASPLLSQSSYLVVMKAVPTDEEFNISLYAADVCGMTYVSRETLELPHNAGTRSIFVYQKTGKAKIKMPRNVGVAQHHPLCPKEKK
ncbi:16S rRNA (guanine(527)-N(7))-methyltransferase RsmG [Atopobium sp. oral taxon 810]|uniref:16S rRNA (guanine(527)-N(7))-methyltransferase RsmG n=1 Tax=Atopobium sp. oral taxon 810 TaxID=712158 RepID=UPI000411CA57|nr:16S rRNA (guanine(527)-N(7))-methyltransferase RsmG [Atopobium sp. oral taxon 810]